MGAQRGDSLDAVRSAYRKRARVLHPDASGDSSTAGEFQELVRAFKELCSIKPGSLETHPLWPRLSGLDRYWARELGYDMAYGDETTDGLEEWLIATTKMDDYVDEDGIELPGLDPSSLEAEAMRQRKLGEQAATWAAEGEEEEEEVVVVKEEEAEEEAGEQSVVGIAELLEFRFYLGNEQWRVRWVGSEAEESWEAYHVLDTDALRQEALRLKARASGGG